MGPKLRFSCAEQWENMRVGVIGRHCFQCEKEVVDFTGKSKEEVVQYLIESKGRSVCGRVRQDQIDVYHEFVEVCIWKSYKAKRSSNLAFYLIAASGLSMTGCGTSGPSDGAQTQPSDTTALQQVSPSGTDASQPDPNLLTQEEADRLDRIMNPIPMFGELLLPDTTTYTGTYLHDLPEVMPEFKGGQDSLYAFIGRHLTYPDWESDHNIHGKVYVEFVIEADGGVSKSRIVRSVKGSKYFDDEVLKVIDMMPAWTPGRNGDEVVATKLVLPISFTL